MIIRKPNQARFFCPFLPLGLPPLQYRDAGIFSGSFFFLNGLFFLFIVLSAHSVI
ncbi:hypothetical protein B4099_3348 [Heyndrickxia coagulans]|uniref:Uncharacterized protein n=1 Tax=Heyndrickxia coagulans TaxID=1398 RepID=A0A150K6Y5_HEYCO|nr:hypothetical protein B4099_3348 [Heyndrickxia coagulans]